MYTSLADYQIKKEEIIQRNPLIMDEKNVEQTPAEILYQVNIFIVGIHFFLILYLSYNLILILKLLGNVAKLTTAYDSFTENFASCFTHFKG